MSNKIVMVVQLCACVESRLLSPMYLLSHLQVRTGSQIQYSGFVTYELSATPAVSLVMEEVFLFNVCLC